MINGLILFSIALVCFVASIFLVAQSIDKSNNSKSL